MMLISSDSGTTLDAQARYANGTKEILRRFFEGQEQEHQNVIVIDGEVSSFSLALYLPVCRYLDQSGSLAGLRVRSRAALIRLQYASKAYGNREVKASGQRTGPNAAWAGGAALYAD
jgi:hypothetical protein